MRTTALVAASIVGTGVAGTWLGAGQTLQDDGNRGSAAAGAIGAAAVLMGASCAAVEAAFKLGSATPIAAMGVAMLGAGALGYTMTRN